jgi:hypothetical protein
MSATNSQGDLVFELVPGRGMSAIDRILGKI